MGSTSGREQRGSFGSIGPTMEPSMWRALSEDSGRTRSFDCREGMNVRVVLGAQKPTSYLRVFVVHRPSIGGHADIGIDLDVSIRFVVGFGHVIRLVDFLRTGRRRIIGCNGQWLALLRSGARSAARWSKRARLFRWLLNAAFGHIAGDLLRS